MDDPLSAVDLRVGNVLPQPSWQPALTNLVLPNMAQVCCEAVATAGVVMWTATEAGSVCMHHMNASQREHAAHAAHAA